MHALSEQVDCIIFANTKLMELIGHSPADMSFYLPTAQWLHAKHQKELVLTNAIKLATPELGVAEFPAMKSAMFSSTLQWR